MVTLRRAEYGRLLVLLPVIATFIAIPALFSPQSLGQKENVTPKQPE
jgi:hypothetical protein